MVLMLVWCPSGQSALGMKGGKTDTETQRSRGHRSACPPCAFLRDPIYPGRVPESNQHGGILSLQGHEIGDTVRVFPIRPPTGLPELQDKAVPNVGQ
jgi:hypothetical protein